MVAISSVPSSSVIIILENLKAKKSDRIAPTGAKAHSTHVIAVEA